jgi:transcriptional regulator GlxA family with amidase domain
MTASDLHLSRSDRTPEMIGFLLIPGFALLAYASAIEPLRAANLLSGRPLYRWRHLSPDGRPVSASNGLTVTPDLRLEDAAKLNTPLVCAGGNPASFRDSATLNRLRLERARLLLRQTGLSVLEVAMACGFASASHFSRCYRAEFGHPPVDERGEAGATTPCSPLDADAGVAHEGRIGRRSG